MADVLVGASWEGRSRQQDVLIAELQATIVKRDATAEDLRAQVRRLQQVCGQYTDSVRRLQHKEREARKALNQLRRDMDDRIASALLRAGRRWALEQQEPAPTEDRLGNVVTP